MRTSVRLPAPTIILSLYKVGLSNVSCTFYLSSSPPLGTLHISEGWIPAYGDDPPKDTLQDLAFF